MKLLLQSMLVMSVAFICSCSSGSDSQSLVIGRESWQVADYLSYELDTVIPEDDDLLLHYDFNAGTGVLVNDLSGNNYTGNLTPWDSGTERGTLWTGGSHGNALLFSESGRVTVESDVALDAALAPASGQLSISLWFKFTDISEDGNFRLVSKKFAWDDTSGFELEMNPVQKRIRFLCRGESFIEGTLPDSFLSVGEWHHIAAVIDNFSGIIRLDGIPVNDPTEVMALGGFLESPAELTIGALANGSATPVAPFNGVIDDLRIYSRALTNSEQVALFVNERPDNGLLAWHRFNEVGPNYADESGFNHDATGAGTTSVTGYEGSAVEFDEVTDGITLADSGRSLALTNAMTIAAWVKVDQGGLDTDNDYYRRIVSKKITDADDSGYEFAYFPTTRDLVFNAGGGKTASVTTNLGNNWRHIAVTVEDTTVTFYVNGNQVGTSTGDITIPYQDETNVRIGRRATDADTLPGTWIGQLDDVRIYGRALSSTEVKAVRNETENIFPSASIQLPLTDLAIIYGEEVECIGIGTDAENGDISTSGVWISSIDGELGTGSYLATSALSYGRHVLTYTVSDADGLKASAQRVIEVRSDPSAQIKFYVGEIATVGSDYISVDLPQSYENPVIFATIAYTESELPAVARVRVDDTDTISFAAQNPSGASLPSAYRISYFVAEAGVYNESDHGIDLEILSVLADNPDNAQSWIGKLYTPMTTFVNPVVHGQVQGDDVAEWSVFWARGTTPSTVPSASAIYIGRHVAEDTNIIRDDQRLGVFISEAGADIIDGVGFYAGVGPESIIGITSPPPKTYSHTFSGAQYALLSSAGIQGNNGGWPVLYGDDALSSTEIKLAYDEDQINDSERGHTEEFVSYILFSDPGAPILTVSSPDDRLISAVGATVTLTASAIDPEDGDISSAIIWTSNRDGALGVGANITSVSLSRGAHVITATVTDLDGYSSQTEIEVMQLDASMPNVRMGKITGVGNSWQNLDFGDSYVNPVVFCTPQYDDTQEPKVVRLQNVTATGCEIKLQMASNSVFDGPVSVSYIVMEAGLYTQAQHGIDMEVGIRSTSKTSRKGSLQGEEYLAWGNYANPVVIGQVQTANDVDWSMFWSSSSSNSQPAQSGNIYIGKHVAEDPNYLRDAEDIGFLIINSGSGSLDGMPYEAGVSNDNIAGILTSPPYFINVDTALIDVAVLSTAGFDGGDGGWPILYGVNAYSASQLQVAIDEDNLGDSDRNHTTEQVAYLLFAQPVVVAK